MTTTAQLDRRLTAVESKLVTDEAAIDDLKTRMAAVEAKLGQDETHIADLDARITALEGGSPSPSPPPSPPPPPLPSGGMSVALALPGGTLTFSEGVAVDLGDYVGDFVHQHCLAQRQGPWLVFFRWDADGSRAEIVVEFGGYDLTKLPPVPIAAPAHVLAPYTATILAGDGSALATVAVQKHWWGARWRWASAPRPVRRSYADLVAMKGVLPLSLSAAWNTVPPTAVAWAGPMSTGGLSPSMGDTGDRGEIGFITEAQAAYLLGDAASLETTLTQAEAVGSFPIWVRDQTTGGLLDVQAHQYLAYNDAFGGSHQIATPPAPSDPDFFQMDAAHLPAPSFVAWLLTDDPYFLEGAQACANYGIINSNYHANNNGLPGLTSVSQTRAWAWGMRDLFRMAAFAPAIPPAWLLPRSYWRANAGDNLALAGKYLSATAPAVSVFHLITESGFLSSFMQDFLEVVMGWAKWSGAFPEWDVTVEWIAGSRIAMSGSAGWDRRWPAPYQVPVVNAKSGAGAPLLNAGYAPADSSLTPLSWAELWSCYLAWSGLDPAGWQPDTLAPGQNLGYSTYARGALAALELAGIAGARAEHDWLYQQLQTAMPGTNPSGFKFAIWPN